MQALLAFRWSEHMDGLTIELPIFLLATFAGALVARPTHIQWAAMLLVLLCRGPGAFSIDHLLMRRSGLR
jgi:uncharacterized membrane protein YphA (DoxX/SURF4 family)